MQSLSATRRRTVITVVLSVIVALVTVHALTLNGITITQDAASEDLGFYSDDAKAALEEPTPESEPAPAPDPEPAPEPEAPAMDVPAAEDPEAGYEELAVEPEPVDVIPDGEGVEGESEGAEVEDEAVAEAADAEAEAADETEASDETESTSESADQSDTAKAGAEKPAQDLRKELQLAEDIIYEVRVEAEAGILPAGTTLSLDPVDDNETIDLIKAEAQKRLQISAEESGVVATDITFEDAKGNKVKPSDKVRVTITSSLIEPGAEVAVVHVKRAEKPEDKDKANVVELKETNLDESTVTFEAKDFSPYALVYLPPAEDESEDETAADDEELDEADVAEEPEHELITTEDPEVVEVEGEDEAEAADGAVEGESAESEDETSDAETTEGEGAEDETTEDETTEDETTEDEGADSGAEANDEEATGDEGEAVDGEATEGESTDGEGTEDESTDGEGETGDGDEGDSESETETPMPAQDFEANVTQPDGTVLDINIQADEGTFPEGVTMKATLVDDQAVLDAAVDQAAAESTALESTLRATAVDITFYDAQDSPIEPQMPVHVSMTTTAITQPDDLSVVHVDEDLNAELLPADDVTATEGEVTFEAATFSVYALVYTVDFHWEVDGQEYSYSVPGGGFASLRQLVWLLGIAGAEQSDADAFMLDVESVEFSNPDLAWLGKVDADTTIGDIKSENSLQPQYSDALTDADIAAIDSTFITAPDWVLISMQPFTSEESLTIIMSNGDRFQIRVTDAQEISAVEEIDASRSYVICYEDNNGYHVLKTDGSVETFASSETFINEGEGMDKLNDNYRWAFYKVFTEKDVASNKNKTYYFIRPVVDKSRTVALNTEGATGENLVREGTNNVAVLPQEGGGFFLEGYKADGSTVPKLYYSTEGDGFFITSMTDESLIHIYQQDYLDRFEYTITSNDNDMGSVQTTGTPMPDANNPTYYIAESTETDTNTGKKNAYEIKAIPKTKMGQSQNKYIFDHWELNGQTVYQRNADGTIKKDENGKPMLQGDTIAPNQLDIPSNGSELKAVFRVNPKYDPDPTNPDNWGEMQGTGFQNMEEWLNSLKNRNIPLNEDGCQKTAEVYDYENRIYRVDLTAQSSLSTFDGTIDLGFVFDISKSMQFPATMLPYKENIAIYDINDNNTNKGWLEGNGPYYLIADEEQTATVFRIFKHTDGNWWTVDASKYNPNNPTGGDARQLGTGELYTAWIQYKDSYGNSHVYSDSDTHYFYHKGDTEHTQYTIYKDDRDGVTRFDDLTDSMSSTIRSMQDLLNVLNIARVEAEDPDVNIAWTTFCGNVPDSQAGSYYQSDLPHQYSFESASSYNDDQINEIVGITEKAGGGTSTDRALTDVQHNFAWDTESTRYVVLITDGAPQKSGTEIPNETVIAAANALRAEDNVKIITIGLSMGNVDRGRALLYQLADEVNGERAFYDVEGADLKNVLLHILKTIMDDATVVGDVTDTVGESFYPVDKETGKPLSPGDWIDIEGNLMPTHDPAIPHGVIQSDSCTIKWENQDFTWEGWHGVVYAKAREDLLGGNAVRTNQGDATIEAKAYKISDGEPVELAPESQIQNTHYDLNKSLPTPLVNVNELAFQQNDTEWTVYLGTQVDPEKQLEKLYESILVEEVVTEGDDTNGDGLPDTMAAAGNNWYSPSEGFSDESEDDDERFINGRKTGVQTFYMKDLIKNLVDQQHAAGTDYSWWNYSTGEPDYIEFFKAAATGNGIVLPYNVYGLDYTYEDENGTQQTHTDNSTITITLKKPADPDPVPLDVNNNLQAHPATPTGDAVEAYVLNILYSPDYSVLPAGQGGPQEVNYHVGTYGNMYQGHAAGTEKSLNNHIINVYKIPLDVLKTNEDGERLSEATFGLYKADEENGSELEGLVGKFTLVTSATSGNDGLASLDCEGGLEPGETYYLIEESAPTRYAKDSTIWVVQLQTETGKYTDLDGKTISAQTYPFNWDQGARVLVDGQPVVVVAKASEAEGSEGGEPEQSSTEEGTTEITDGSFVSHKAAISFRHTVENMLDEISINVTKTWEDEDNPPDQIEFEIYRVSEKGHDWGEGTIVPCTCAGEGVKLYTCQHEGCNAERRVVISKAPHYPGPPQRENETPATCTASGSYDSVIYCTVCGAEISRETIEIPVTGHSWETVEEPYQGEDNYCYDTVSRCAVCNVEREGSRQHHNHIWGDWEVTTPAQPGVAGVETRICTHDASHVETRPVDPLPNNTTITIRTYRDWYQHGRFEQTTQAQYPIGSTITLTWSSNINRDYNVDAYINSNRTEYTGGWNTFDFSGGTVLRASKTGSAPIVFSVTVTVTENMTLDLKASVWDDFPSNITITQNRTTSEAPQSLRSGMMVPNLLEARKLNESSLPIASPMRGERDSSTSSMTSDELANYLDGLPSHDEASCVETEGVDHAYAEKVGDTYTITASDGWTLPEALTLPKYNDYGNEYTYYVKETDPESGLVYETTYLGQANGLHDGDEVTINNRMLKGSLKLTKIVKVNSADPTTEAERQLVDGDYVFTIVSGEGITPAITKYVQITVDNGVAASYKIADSADGLSGAPSVQGAWALVPDLPVGAYTITETNLKIGMTLQIAARGDGDTDAVSADKTVTVIVTDGADVPTDASAAAASFTNNIDTVTVKIKKQWEHGDNTDVPESLTVYLSNGETRVLNADNGWEATIEDLPKYDAHGALIPYSWTEDELPAGYYLSNIEESTTTSQAGVTIISTTLTNTYTDHYMPLTMIKGKKIWDDNGIEDRPASITVNLYQGNSTEPYETITVNAPTGDGADPNQWPFEFTNLPIFDDNGNVIQYRVEEVLPEGYGGDYTIKTEFTQATYVPGTPTGTIVNSGEGAQEFEIASGTDLGYIVIRHGNDFIVWTPRPAAADEVNMIKEEVATLSDQFNGIASASGSSLKIISGVPRTVDVGNKHAVSVYMNGDTVMVKFLNPNAWSDFAYGKIPYTYTPAGGEGGGTITNTKKVTDFEFSKKWIDFSGQEAEWDRDIQATVERDKGDGTKDDSFSLVYNITASSVVNGAEIPAAQNPDANPKLKVTVTTEAGKAKYKFTLQNLPYSSETDGKYTYYATETNAQLEGYLAPSYSNSSAPTGAAAAYDGGTIVNQQEGGVALPHTGGPGTNFFTLFGTMFTALAGVGFVVARKRKRTSHKM